MGYLDEACDEWVCEDNSLESKRGQLCGTTGHFTSFAILIGANLNTGCGADNTVNQVLAWLSLGLAILAIGIFFLCAVGKEVSIRIRRARIDGTFGRSDRVWQIEQNEHSNSGTL